MAEIKTQPIKGVDDDGDEVVCFNAGHTLADVARWILENRQDAEEIHRMLGDELSKPALIN